MNLNKASIIGNLTKDPVSRTLPSGQSITTFSVATNHVWRDKSQNKKESTEFHNVVAWGKLGEICGQYLKKGGKVYVEGRLQTRNWEDSKTKVRKSRTEIVADELIMLGHVSSKKDEQNDSIRQETLAREEVNAEELPVEENAS
ncbi:MAG: single-stranded DNA-binding protein [bacterium]|nr:single-stranded DNA-binding protein [bacterium]